MQDKIIEEVRRVREGIAKRNNYDVRKIAQEIQERKANWQPSSKATQEESTLAKGTA